MPPKASFKTRLEKEIARSASSMNSVFRSLKPGERDEFFRVLANKSGMGIGFSTARVFQQAFTLAFFGSEYRGDIFVDDDYYGESDQLEKYTFNVSKFKRAIKEVELQFFPIHLRKYISDSPWTYNVPKDPDPKTEQAYLNALYKIEQAFDKAVETAQRDFAKREKKWAKVPKEAPNAVFNKFAFADKRIRNAEVPPETDNTVERDVFQDIDDHFDGGDKINKKNASRLKSILRKGQYNDVIHPPKEKIMYRGMGVDVDVIKKLINWNPKEWDKIPLEGQIVGSFTFKPIEGQSSSWTRAYKTAKKFSSESSSYRASIIMHARVSENPDVFMSGPDGLYKLDGPNTYSNEQETVGLGNIKIYKIDYKIPATAVRSAVSSGIDMLDIDHAKMIGDKLKSLAKLSDPIVSEYTIEDTFVGNKPLVNLILSSSKKAKEKLVAAFKEHPQLNRVHKAMHATGHSNYLRLRRYIENSALESVLNSMHGESGPLNKVAAVIGSMLDDGMIDFSRSGLANEVAEKAASPIVKKLKKMNVSEKDVLLMMLRIDPPKFLPNDLKKVWNTAFQKAQKKLGGIGYYYYEDSPHDSASKAVRTAINKKYKK